MKCRQGFVSNSSSTSFVVAFIPEQDNLNLKTLDFLLSGQYQDGTINLKIFRATVKERHEELSKELTTLERDRKWLDDHTSMLVECMGITGVQVLMDELEKHESAVKDSESIRWRRRSKGATWKDVIQEHISNYKDSAKKIDGKTNEVKKQLKLISDLPEDTVVARWEQGHGESMLTKLISMLKEDGRVVVLEEINT